MSANRRTSISEPLNQVLQSNSLHIKNREKVLEKINRILEDGVQNVHVISDFDMTISKYWVNGERNVGSHRLLALSSRVTAEFREKTDAVYRHYYPIEISRTVSHEDKVQAMVEWWTKAHESILELKLTKDDLERIAHEVQIVLREGAVDFADLCAKMDVPLLVFSAGLGDAIEAVLKNKGMLKPNVHIVSNMLRFDSKGVGVAFHEPLIHTFNKNEAAVGGPYIEAIIGRTNVILMGDSIGDLQMGEGLKHDVQLTIGFLNHDKDALIDEYASAFDIVVLDDGPMSIAIEILSFMK
ncbi:pyrimidine 5'-nucleotidase [Fimicolochytrium jonesii]|uniref:pyrimidine 5'-nucleotidase n=1 Tax=Fimicolochytrium jonesii TaxID=1396493 RepID=UPI0022FDF57E|nr:pyrimidine 5'-nucleotidase [Fimicolochytrium jonesii]KAI8823504.1 pyrimidine 5'-nucleotidase [Fimicolochytrium jonesii]